MQRLSFQAAAGRGWRHRAGEAGTGVFGDEGTEAVGRGFRDKEQQVQSQEMRMCTVCTGAVRIRLGSSSGRELGLGGAATGFAAGPGVKRMEGFWADLDL